MSALLRVASKESLRGGDERVPALPCLTVMAGLIRSGKSTLLVNLLERRCFYRNAFQRVIYCSGSYLSDATIKCIREDEAILGIHTHEDLLRLGDLITALIAVCTAESGTPAEKQTCLVLDDCLGYIPAARAALDNLGSKFRHLRISLFISIQCFRACPLLIRLNMTNLFLWHTADEREVEKYTEELGGMFENFAQAYRTATAAPYTPLHVDKQRGVLRQGISDIVLATDTKRPLKN